MSSVRQQDRMELLRRVTHGWRALLRAQPDATPRAGERGRLDDALADAVVRSALASPQDSGAAEALERAAAEYARLPRRRRFEPRTVLGELSMLRNVVWVSLRDCFPPGAERVAFLKTLDRATMAAHRATVRARPDEEDPPAKVEAEGSGPERRVHRDVRF